MSNQLSFSVDQILEYPDLFIIRVRGPSDEQIEAFMTLDEVSSFLQDLGTQCVTIAQQCQQIQADQQDETFTPETATILH